MRKPERGGADPSEITSGTLASALEQLEKHNAKEEPILFPQADTVLTAAASASLKAFLAAGRTPEGWVAPARAPRLGAERRLRARVL